MILVIFSTGLIVITLIKVNRIVLYFLGLALYNGYSLLVNKLKVALTSVLL